MCVCVSICSCGHQKVKTMTPKQRLPTKLFGLMVGRVVAATVGHLLAELHWPNYDCYLISSYVARRQFLYLDGTSCERAWCCGQRHSVRTAAVPSHVVSWLVTDTASWCYLWKFFVTVIDLKRWLVVAVSRLACCSCCLCTCMCVCVCMQQSALLVYFLFVNGWIFVLNVNDYSFVSGPHVLHS